MVNVLIVDDNLERIREITSYISNDYVVVDYSTTKNEALRKIEDTQYDLAIIDIMLPENISSIYPNKTAGVELINDINSRIRVKVPKNLLGITSDSDTYNENKVFFEERLIPILIWKPEDETWKNKILNKIDFIKSTQKQLPPKADIAIITAVSDEYNAVKESFDDWEPINIFNDPDTYFITQFVTKTEKKQTVLLAQLPEMGLTSASSMTTKIILEFSPSKVFMVGICGGIKGTVNLCDVVVAASTWDYGSGKIKPKNDSSNDFYKFEPSPNQIPIDPSVVDGVKYSASSFLDVIAEKWNLSSEDKPVHPQIKIGPLPSGASVISDPELFEEIIKPQHRKCLGLDMETYGVYYAAKHTSAKPIDFLSIKAVSDFADDQKNDDYHKACCFFSSNLLKECLINEVL